MSTSPDPELVELALEFEGLSITVRGAPTAATNFVQGLQRGSAHHSAAAGYQSPSGTGARGRAPSSAASPSASVGETRDSILASFPACPGVWIGLANQELGLSQDSSRKSEASLDCRQLCTSCGTGPSQLTKLQRDHRAAKSILVRGALLQLPHSTCLHIIISVLQGHWTN